METFALVSGIASILGLVASVWAVIEVRRLRHRYVRMVLLPRWTERLDDHASQLTALLRTAEGDLTEVRDELARLDATLAALTRLVPRSNKQEVKAVQALIRQTRPLRDEDQVRSIRTGVYGLTRTLQLHIEEDRWT